MQGINDLVKKKCPKCKKMKLQRLIGSGSAVLFKGPGFYATDYRSENYKKSTEKKPVFSNKTIKKGPAKTQREQ